MKPLTPDRQAAYESNKRMEKLILQLPDLAGLDPRWAAIARTQFELGFMALNRALSEGQP